MIQQVIFSAEKLNCPYFCEMFSVGSAPLCAKIAQELPSLLAQVDSAAPSPLRQVFFIYSANNKTKVQLRK